MMKCEYCPGGIISTKTKTFLLFLICTVFISGCVIFPGSHLSSRDRALEKVKAGKGDKLKDVNLVKITPSLIAQMQKKDKNTVAQAASSHADSLSKYIYRIAPHDVLTITVWEHPELTIPAGSFRSADESGNQVFADGTLYYPYAGKVKVSGLTVPEVRDLLTEKLGRVIEKPQVDVRVSKYNGKRFYVTGAVNKAGVFPVREVPTTLLDAISLAGGLANDADWTDVVLSRDGARKTLSLADLYQYADMSNNVILQHGDTIHVSRDDYLKVFVLGEVKTPQAVRINRTGMTLAEAITDAGGLNELTSNPTGIFVLRQPSELDNKPSVYQLNARSATAFILAEQFNLQKRDIVYVTAAPISRWNRVITLLLPTVSGLNEVSEFLDRVDPGRFD